MYHDIRYEWLVPILIMTNDHVPNAVEKKPAQTEIPTDLILPVNNAHSRCIQIRYLPSVTYGVATNVFIFW